MKAFGHGVYALEKPVISESGISGDFQLYVYDFNVNLETKFLSPQISSGLFPLKDINCLITVDKLPAKLTKKMLSRLGC
jgi:hypothetical protein